MFRGNGAHLQTQHPVKIKDDFLRMKDNAEVEKFVINLAVQTMTDVIKNGITYGFHLFTLKNLRKILTIS
jgi:5,10-methylenetetrahydrofolate reductase